MTWREAVEAAVRRQAVKDANGVFTRQDLLAAEKDRIQSDSGGGGETPEQILSGEDPICVFDRLPSNGGFHCFTPCHAFLL